MHYSLISIPPPHALLLLCSLWLGVSATEVVSSDVWLADMNYRVAVTQQGRVWKGASAKLGDLFSSMKDIEVERRKVGRLKWIFLCRC